MAVKYHRFYCTVCTKDTFCAFMRTFAKKRKNPKDRNFDAANDTVAILLLFFKMEQRQIGKRIYLFPRKERVLRTMY